MATLRYHDQLRSSTDVPQTRMHSLSSTTRTTVGQGRECTLRLHSAFLSRVHCGLDPEADGYILRDLGSASGTRLNGQLVSGPRRLVHGDIIVVSDVELVFEDLSAAPPLTDSPVAMLRTACEKAGIPTPPLPPPLGDSLKSTGAWCWSTRELITTPYWHPDYLAEWTRSPQPDSLLFAHDGHGSNSYALLYYLVQSPLGLFVKLPWGGSYSDPELDLRLIQRTFIGIGTLLSAMQERLKKAPWPQGQRLLVFLAAAHPSYWQVLTDARPVLGALDTQVDGYSAPSRRCSPEQTLAEVLEYIRR